MEQAVTEVLERQETLNIGSEITYTGTESTADFKDFNQWGLNVVLAQHLDEGEKLVVVNCEGRKSTVTESSVRRLTYGTDLAMGSEVVIGYDYEKK